MVNDLTYGETYNKLGGDPIMSLRSAVMCRIQCCLRKQILGLQQEAACVTTSTKLMTMEALTQIIKETAVVGKSLLKKETYNFDNMKRKTNKLREINQLELGGGSSKRMPGVITISP